MAYSSELPREPGYYWVKGNCDLGHEIECIVHIDKTFDSMRTNIPNCMEGYTNIEKYRHFQWSGPIDRPLGL